MLHDLILQRIAQKKVFWAERWERRAIAELANSWDEAQDHLAEVDLVRNVPHPALDDSSQQPDVVKMRQFCARESLGQLGWSSKGKVNKEAERAVELFNNSPVVRRKARDVRIAAWGEHPILGTQPEGHHITAKGVTKVNPKIIYE